MSGGPLVLLEALSAIEARPRHAGRMRFIITSRGSENRPLDPGRAGALNCFSWAPVAQMDRAVASGATGRRFESCQAYQLSDFRVTTHAQPAATLANPGSCAITHGEPDLQNQNLDEARKAPCAWVAPDLRERCAVREVVRHGNSAEQVVAEPKSAEADLVVVGGQPRESLGAMLFESTTEALIRHAPCPVLSIVQREANRGWMARQDGRPLS
jgi:hypothetical protein